MLLYFAGLVLVAASTVIMMKSEDSAVWAFGGASIGSTVVAMEVGEPKLLAYPAAFMFLSLLCMVIEKRENEGREYDLPRSAHRTPGSTR